jgi:hypothetical protein
MDARRFGEAGATFKACLQWEHPEILKMVEVAGFAYTDEAIVLSFLGQQRDIFKTLCEPPGIDALRDAARKAEFNVKMKLGAEEVLIHVT